jgi:hypothetical protein
VARRPWLPSTLAAPAGWARLDRPFAALWLALTAGAALRLVAAARRVRRGARRWPRRVVLGTAVRVSPDVGPAVAGALRPAVVVPRWALDDPRLSLMLAHETAHVRARDPLLVAAAHAAAVLVAWNPVAWWQLRRLRGAVEVDCDRRVLGVRAVDVRTYGALLLDVAARRPTAPLPVLALIPTPTLLHQRIDAMTARRPAHAVLRALVSALPAAALVALACETPRPTAPRPMARVPLTDVVPAATDAAAGTEPSATTSSLTVAELRAALAAHVPQVLHAATGHEQRVWVLQEADGRVSRVDLETTETSVRGLRLGGVRLSMADSARTVRVRSVSTGAPVTVAEIEPARIEAVDVIRLAPGRVSADSLNVILVRLRPAQIAAGQAPSDTAGTPVAAASPLYVVDGVEVPPPPGRTSHDAPPASLPAPERIDRVDVLKGDQAVAAFGERGRGGVVRIVTKAASGRP